MAKTKQKPKLCTSSLGRQARGKKNQREGKKSAKKSESKNEKERAGEPVLLMRRREMGKTLHSENVYSRQINYN